jgi:hypothetical protein
VLCLRGNLSRGFCPNPVHFDVLDHHPYPIAGPRHHAANSADVAIPDMHKLSRILNAARRHRTVLPRGPKALAVTEISWDSRPPDPNGVPAWRHAAWLADALYVLWKQHVQTVLWFRVVDQAPVPSYAMTNQSGLYFKSGRAKPAQRAFAFPFACERRKFKRYRIWGMAPRPRAPVLVQLRRPGRWTNLTTVRSGRDRVFTAKLTGPAYQLRAIQGRRVSLRCALDALGK